MKSNTPAVQNNTFSTVLNSHRDGELVNELSKALQELTLAVKEQCKQGKLTLEVTVSPANGDGSALLVVGDVKLKLPKGKRPAAIFYSTDEGILSRKDPNQHEMQLQEVPRTEVAPIATLPQPKSALA